MQAQADLLTADHIRTARKRGLISLLKVLPFLMPWILGLLFLTLYPIGASFYYGMTHYSVVKPPRFIGLQNYQDILFDNKTFRIVLTNTLYFVIVGVPGSVISAYLIANLLNNKIWMRSVFRTIFFLPSIVPAVSSVMVWLWIYNTQFGLLAGLFQMVNLQAIPFLSDPKLAKPALIIMQMWAQGTSIVIFLAALQDVPRELYEQASIDGAGALRRFLHVTVPMTTSAMLYLLITQLIGTFQTFILPYLLTDGGPNQATELYGVYLYRNAFEQYSMGYASALAWILFAFIIVFSIGLFKTFGRLVYYAG